jgi:hypothetical protein
VEQTDDGRYAVRARGSRRASGLRDTQNEVRALAGCGKRRFLSEFPLGAPISTIVSALIRTELFAVKLYPCV